MAKGSSSGIQRRSMPRSYTISALEFVKSDLGSFPRLDLAPVPDLKYRYGGSTQQWAKNNLTDWRLEEDQWDWQSGLDFQHFTNTVRKVPSSAVPSPPPETLVQFPRNESDVVAKMVAELLGPLLHLFKRAGWIPSKAKGIQMDKYVIHLECLSESSIPDDSAGPGSGSAATNDSETGTSLTRDTTASTTTGKGKGKQIRFAVGTKPEQPELELEPKAPKTGNLGLALRIDTIFVLSLLEQTPPPATAG